MPEGSKKLRKSKQLRNSGLSEGHPAQCLASGFERTVSVTGCLEPDILRSVPFHFSSEQQNLVILYDNGCTNQRPESRITPYWI
jgi:hypothetical protein